MEIVKIIADKKRKNKVNITFDDDSELTVNFDIIYKYNLKEKMVVTEDFINNILNFEQQNSCNEYALSILSKGYKTEKELTNKLLKKGYSDETIKNTLDFVKKYNFVNDNEYTSLYIKYKANSENVGQNIVKLKLSEKGIDNKIIENEIKNIDEEQQYKVALNLAKNKLFSLKNKSNKSLYQKIGSFLEYKGFTIEIIEKVLDKLNLKNDYIDY